jgi:hypothetical protein
MARQTTSDKTCLAYIEWGGAYDCRELELLEFEGCVWWEELTGGYLNLNRCLTQDHTTRQVADTELLEFIFNLGESCSFVEFYDRGIIRKRDYVRRHASQTEAK